MDIIAKKAAKARENFSEFLDEADKRPVFINRKRETYVVFPTQFINSHDPWKIKIRYGYDETEGASSQLKQRQPKERVYFTKNDIFPDVIGWGNSKSEALRSFTEDLIALCYDFYDNFHIYSSIPCRQHQTMPVLKILSVIASGGDVTSIIEEGKS